MAKTLVKYLFSFGYGIMFKFDMINTTTLFVPKKIKNTTTLNFENKKVFAQEIPQILFN